MVTKLAPWGGPLGAGSVDDDLPAWFAYNAVWQLPYLDEVATVEEADLQEQFWNVRSPLYDITIDDELPAWFAFNAVWNLPYMTETATVDGLDLQEELWNVRVPTYDLTAFKAYLAGRRGQIIGSGF